VSPCCDFLFRSSLLPIDFVTNFYNYIKEYWQRCFYFTSTYEYVSMAVLLRGFASVFTPEMGLRIEVEVTSRVCTQDAIFGLYQRVSDGGG
jgi:hypothetical protein